MTRFLVRLATPADAVEAATLHVEAWKVAYVGIMPTNLLANLDLDAWIERKRRDYTVPRPGVTHLVACDVATGRLAGLASIGYYRHEGDWGRPDPSADEVYAIYAAPDHWGLGAGRALMDGALASRPRRPVRLWVLADNRRARRFYERYGFVLDGAVATISYDGVMSFDGTGDLAEVRYTLVR